MRKAVPLTFWLVPSGDFITDESLASGHGSPEAGHGEQRGMDISQHLGGVLGEVVPDHHQRRPL